MSLKWPNKDPNEIADYDVDWTLRLYSATELDTYNDMIEADPTRADEPPAGLVVPADSIATSTFTLPAGSLVANSTSNTTTAAKVWLAGGDVGLSYAVLNQIVTAGGRHLDQTVKLKIKSK